MSTIRRLARDTFGLLVAYPVCFVLAVGYVLWRGPPSIQD